MDYNVSSHMMRFGNIGLEKAICAKSIVEVKHLLQCGASPRTIKPGPLHLAAFVAQDIEIVRLLIEYGAPVDELDPQNLLTPLVLSVRRGNLDIVQYLLEKGANHEHVTGIEPMPLSLTMKLNNGTKEYFERNVCPWRYNTPLIEACRYRHFDVVKELLARGADVNKESIPGKTAVHIASFCMTPERYVCVYNDSAKFRIMPTCPPILDVLIESGADVCTLNELGETPVGSVLNHITTIWKYSETTKYVLQCLTHYFLNLCLLVQAGCPLTSAYTVELDSRPKTADKQTIRTFSILINAFIKHNYVDARLLPEMDDMRKAFISVMTVAFHSGLKPHIKDLDSLKQETADSGNSDGIKTILALMESLVSNTLSLKQLCETKLRQTIKPPLLTNVHGVVLPKSLKENITMDFDVGIEDQIKQCLNRNDYPGYITFE